MAQSYGVKEYWTERYHNDGLGDDPFDWMVGWDQLEGIVTELVPKRARILVVGCGNAPLSPDMDASGFTNAIHMDSCELVIEQQRRKFPHMKWEVEDGLNMTYEDSSFDAIIDKSLIDTIMCYDDGITQTHNLFAELHRVLKPNGRLVTISLHKEDEVDIFAKDIFAVTTGKIKNLKALEKKEMRDTKSLYNTIAVFDALNSGLGDEEIWKLHPMNIPCVMGRKELEMYKIEVTLSSKPGPRRITFNRCETQDLIPVFGAVMDDWKNIISVFGDKKGECPLKCSSDEDDSGMEEEEKKT